MIVRDDILFFIDNDVNKQGKYLDECPIKHPKALLETSYDKVVLMSAKIEEMKKQLFNMGISRKLIWTYQQYFSEIYRGILKIVHYRKREFFPKKSVLIITTELGYSGGILAALRAAQVLSSRNYTVVLCAPKGDDRLLEEIADDNYSVILCPSLYYISDTELFWIKQFDFVLVNVFQMLQCACEISRVKPVMWWVHEPLSLYNTRHSYDEYDNLKAMKNVHVYAVSKVAKKNFEYYYPDKVSGILSLGIPDEYIEESQENNADKKVVFATIGGISEIKGQIFFAKAVSYFSLEERSNAEFWIIGKTNENTLYYQKLKQACSFIPQIKFVGELTREELRCKYREIDVVVCASLEETLSIAVIEGMMHKKICITTSNTGIAEYIDDGVNGFICDVGDSVQLYERMSWIMKNRNNLDNIRINARKTYEEYFSMEQFGDRLEKEIVAVSQSDVAFKDEIINKGV